MLSRWKRHVRAGQAPLPRHGNSGGVLGSAAREDAAVYTGSDRPHAGHRVGAGVPAPAKAGTSRPEAGQHPAGWRGVETLRLRDRAAIGEHRDQPPRGFTGTIAYMPPESFEGTVSTAWEMWALGVPVHDALTGRVPVLR